MRRNILFAIIYLIIDILWITTMSRSFYKEKIQKVQFGKEMVFKTIPAILAYTTLLIVLFFICIPLAEYYKKKYPKWMVFGVVGFCVYGVYNFTNGAIFYNYDTMMMVVDTLWGFLSFMFLGYLHDLLVKTVSF